MNEQMNLQRFVRAQEADYPIARSEIKNGKKRSHWMWYIFPQIRGLGFSDTARYYGIADVHEATAYMRHPILGKHLIELSEILLSIPERNANKVFGSPDDMKLKSSMTLFAALENANSVFQKVLDKFFNGTTDDKTLSILAAL